MTGKTESMKVEEPKELPLIDEGDYTAKVSAVEADIDGVYGLMVRIHFNVDGNDITALASQNLNPNTKLFKWAEILMGKKIKVGENLSFESLIGNEALVTVRNRPVKDSNGEIQKDDKGDSILTSVIKEVRVK